MMKQLYSRYVVERQKQIFIAARTRSDCVKGQTLTDVAAATCLPILREARANWLGQTCIQKIYYSADHRGYS